MLKQDVGSRTAEDLALGTQDLSLPGALDVADPQPRRGLDNQAVPVPKAVGRRRFTAGYKRRIVEQADACSQAGEVGALLRREGLYASNLSTFRRQLEAGGLTEGAVALNQQASQERAAAKQNTSRAMERLERENQRLRAIIDIQKKVCELLNLPMEEVPPRSGTS